MSPSGNEPDLFAARKVCVLVPTYNNASTLPALLSAIREYTTGIVVVNDGSTDSTLTALRDIPGLTLVNYSPNHGKGYALKRGFEKAVELGYDYAISIDSDGQHFPADLPVFLKAIVEEPGSLLIGARNMGVDNVPAKSNFGNRFSNFWFRVETGIRLPDTQSGYRLYPVTRLSGMHFFTRKYEFEIEVLVRAAWKGIRVKAVPVGVYYPPAAERISHFRPFRDFTRISMLNTVLVTIAFLYIRPRDFFRRIFRKRNWAENLHKEFFDPGQSAARKAISVGFGLFMGIVPIWGFQLIVAIFLALALKLNKTLVVIFANISIPPMIPLIIFLSYQSGRLVLPAAKTHPVAFSKSLGLDSIRENFAQYLAGSILLSVITGLAGGLISYSVLLLLRKKNSPQT